MTHRQKRATILLVEDNPADQRLALEALRESSWACEVFVVEDGAEVMRFLKKEGPYSTAPTPDLIFLDLNLPKKDGREVLKELKNSAEYRRIPVVVLTTSDAEEDVINCYNHHANCYITKPVGIDDFFTVIEGLESFWFSLVKLPRLAACTV